MIANRNLVSIFIDAAGDYFVIGLFSFGYDVEGVADFNSHVLILRRMVNVVFADELLRAAFVLFVETNRSGGQRHSQLVLLRIAKLHEDADLVFNHRARTVVAVIVVSLAVDDELFADVEA